MISSSRKILLVAGWVLSLFALIPMIGYAGSTGQIKGKITSEDGEPAIGATIMIVGTSQGGNADLDGKFTILRVDAGTYSLKISHNAYKTVVIENVVVKADLTTEQNLVMTKSVTELDEVVIVKGIGSGLDIFQTTSRVNISQEEIKTRPVASVDQILKSVAGIQTNTSGEVFIRGGRAGEVAYIVDGVPITDPLGGVGSSGANISLVSGSIAGLQIIKDGFDPEYGNALSGIVNISSQVGNKDNTKITLQWMTDDLGNSSLNKYSRNYDRVVASISGPDPIIRDKILPALGLNFLAEQEFTFYLYGEIEKNDGVHQYSSYDTPGTSREWKTNKFLFFDISDRLINRYNFQINTKFRPRPNLKFVFSYKKWHSKRTVFDWTYRYSAASAPIEWNDQVSIGLEITHAVSDRMNYEIMLSIYENETTRMPGDRDNPGKGLTPDEFRLQSEYEDWEDTNKNGVYDPPEPIINIFPDTTSYGTNFSGPRYSFGDSLFLENTQGGGTSYTGFTFNNNGIWDSLEGEAYLDLNGNGVWDRGEYLNDKNGNGLLDDNRLSFVNAHDPEPYLDGDVVLGEPFHDADANGIYDPAIDIFIFDPDNTINQDLNRNGKYDGPDEQWTPGIPYQDRNGNGVYDRPDFQYDPGEPYVDINDNGKYDYGGTSTFLSPGQMTSGSAEWEHRKTRRYRGEIKIVREEGRHQLKTGFALERNDLLMEEVSLPYLPYTGRDDGGSYPDRGAFRDFYSYAPWSGTVYGRDKIEYGSMIAMLGLRWDFFLQDVNELATVLQADDRGGLIEGDRQALSPRIGFSYPISDKAKVYFNYGHFFQLPGFTSMYARNTSSVNQSLVLGYPNLDYEKTVQYSFGVKYAMSSYYTIDIQGYFKDEFDKVNQKSVLDGYVRRNEFRNSDYGRSRGLELTMEKRGGGYVNGQVSYTYAFAFGKASQTNENFMTDFQLSRETLTEHALSHDIRHSLKAGLQFYIGTNVKPRLFGIPIINGWSLSIQSQIESGTPFTPSKDYPFMDRSGTNEDPEPNSLRLPATAVFDIRFSKEFDLVGIDWNFILWVENVFDSRNVEGVYSSTGRPDTDQNISGVVLGGTDFSANPGNYDYGRQIQLGVSISL